MSSATHGMPKKGPPKRRQHNCRILPLIAHSSGRRCRPEWRRKPECPGIWHTVGSEERQSTKGKINYHHCDIFICQRNFPRVAFLRSLKGHYTRCSPCRMININVLEKTLAIWPGISLHFGWRKNKKRK